MSNANRRKKPPRRLPNKTRLLRLKHGYVLMMARNPILDHERPPRTLILLDSEFDQVLRVLGQSR